jgi:predicted nuclease of predicted toxin-antitoxin system
MKIKLDENMPVSLADTLRQLGHNVHTVPEEGLSGSADEAIWEAVQEEKRFLITQDLEFLDIRRFSPGTHGRILIVRLRTPGRIALHQMVARLYSNENTEEWISCLILSTERKLRFHRPK